MPWPRRLGELQYFGARGRITKLREGGSGWSHQAYEQSRERFGSVSRVAN